MILRRVSPGEPVRAEDYNRLVDLLMALVPRAVVAVGPGLAMQQGANGTTITVTTLPEYGPPDPLAVDYVTHVFYELGTIGYRTESGGGGVIAGVTGCPPAPEA